MRIKLATLGILLFLILPLSVIAFTGAKSYEPSSDNGSASLISNAYVLQDSVPKEVYEHVLTRVERYHQQEGLEAESYTIKDGKIYRDSEGYSFALVPSNDGDTIPVHVVVENYGNFFGITVTIDGKVQDIS